MFPKSAIAALAPAGRLRAAINLGNPILAGRDPAGDVAAGVKQQLEADARRVGGLRLLDGRFMVIQQAMGLPRNAGAEAAALLAGFVEQAKSDGFVAEALGRHRVQGASVAPAAIA